MKYFRWKIFCFLLLLSGLSVGSAQSRKIRIACVGNSITEGYGLKNRQQDSYPAVLQRLLGESYEVMNFGCSGRTLMNKGDRPYMREERFREALASSPDIVTIKLGTNDSKIQNWRHKADFVSDFKVLIDSFQNLPSHPLIYLCLPVPPVGEKWTICDSVVYREVIPLIRLVAAEESLPLIDLYTPLKSYPELFPDNIHPNRAGAALIAEEIARRLLLDAVTGKWGAKRINSEAEILPDDAVSDERKAKSGSVKTRFKRHRKKWK